jgi:hypothetical protein
MIAMVKAAFNKKRALFTSTLDLELSKRLVKCYIWSITFYGAEIWALRKLGQKHLGNFKTRCWRRVTNVSYMDRVRNEVLHRVKEEWNIVHAIRRKGDCIGYSCVGSIL